ncbi:MAG TPA: nitrogen regulation protein NR(II) [Arenicellales bacterium]|nr:nitrogen regulation protein NR(II) [Arenicellales bacterium]
MKTAPHLQSRSAGDYINSIQTALLGCDGELRVWEMNPAAEALFEVSARHARGRKLPELFLDGDAIAECARQALEKEHTVSAYELPVALAPHRSINVDLTVTPLRRDSEPVTLLLELTRADRFRSRDREEQRADRHAAGREMLRGLAHEIKNPLGGLRGAAQLLDDELSDRELREYTRIIIHEADRLRNLVDRIMGSYRPIEPRVLNIHEVLEHVRKLVQAEMREGLTITRDYDPSLPPVDGDREQLIQVVLNIVRNAVEALEGSGEIRLRTRVVGARYIGRQWHQHVISVDIEDNGPGIPEDLQERVFYPMITTRPGGNGLGLSIAQDVIHRHGGAIELESQPGHTRFSLLLPWSRGEDSHED